MEAPKPVRSADLTTDGAQGVIDLINQFHDAEGRQQPFLSIELDDGTVIDKAEIVKDLDGPHFILRLSGL